MSNERVEKDIIMLRRFIAVYCRGQGHEQNGEATLCEECHDLLVYAEERLKHCPLDPKPKCKKCPVHCYQDAYRRKIKEVMKFSGMYFVKRGRLDWLARYFLR